MQKAVVLSKLRPNPFRNMDRYPISRDKIEALKDSFEKTGFWGNIVGRERDGHVEIAYGHHRLITLREVQKPRSKVDIIIRKLTDEAMLQMMARENMEEWGTSAVIEQETVHAVVQAFADGKIKLGKVAAKTPANHLRYAPSFIAGDVRATSPEHPYNAQTVAEFLGWTEHSGAAQRKVNDALTALEMMERKTAKPSQFKGLRTSEAGRP